MTPFFKLTPGWEKTNTTILLIGPEGLISEQVISSFCQQHKHPIRRALITSAQDCMDLRETLSTQSLFEDDELWLIRLTKDSLLSSLKLSNCLHKKMIIFGVAKKPTKCEWIKGLSLVIQSYPLKEPFASKEVIKIAKTHGLQITPKAAKWIVLCHQGREALIPSMLIKAKQIYGSTSLSDDALRSILKQQSEYSPVDILNILTQCKSTLKLMIKSTESTQWPSIYWLLTSYWRKLYLCKEDPSQLKQLFPWKNQQQQANKILKHYTQQELQQQHLELANMEITLKGHALASFEHMIALWLLKYAVS
ncbi:hypothetical protein OAT84_01765 [Gammaproteobacteria bacterium]|nr:hypothetical protein [Gammaproteobacteria bacterium]